MNTTNDTRGRPRTGDWIQTASGKQFFPLDPRPDDICIFDIAHSLANQCRYAGHCSRFYSVAEHSVLVAQVVPPEHKLQALLHDATEAYLVDVPRPIKPYLTGYKEIEHQVWVAVAMKFRLPVELHQTVQHADVAVLMAEKAALMGPSPGPWGFDVEPADVQVRAFAPEVARWHFLDTFNRLISGAR